MDRSSAFKELVVLFASGLVTTGYGSAAELPDDKHTEWTVQKDIFVPMRDGIHLDTDVWLPKGTTGRLPTVLVRTLYDKDKMENQSAGAGSWAEFFVKHGFAVVVQNLRGRYFSEGDYTDFLQGGKEDGFDTIDWIVKQSWSNGKVGTTGCSDSGDTQWPTAAANHPAHAAMIPVSSGTAIGGAPGNRTRGAFYRGGVPIIGIWAPEYAGQEPSERLLLPPHSTQEQRIRLRASYSLMLPPSTWFSVSTIDHLPSQDILHAAGGALSAFDRYITWTPADHRWDDAEPVGANAQFKVPTLLVDSWHDPTIGESTRLFKYLQDSGNSNQFLIIGAGGHCVSYDERRDLATTIKGLSSAGISEVKTSDLENMTRSTLANLKVGDLEIGDARYGGLDQGYTQLYLHWLGYWLKGEQNHVIEMPKVQLYVMGKGWIFSDRWPLKEAHYTKYYLSEDSAVPHRQGSGMLSTSVPKYANNKNSYEYDPSDPTPSRGGDFGMFAVDQRTVEARKDVLVYSTTPLEKPVTVVGPIEVVLYVSSSAKDTDFFVKLVDVYPGGKTIDLNNDAFRVRYREGFDKKLLMQPSEVYKISLPNMVTGIRFAKGHRIRLDIASSNFPLYERNLNTGGNNYDETSWVVAENSVHHGLRYPSHIALPLLPE